MELFTQEKISRHLTKIRTTFGVCVYFVQGNDRGLLIDTGMGIGDLKGFLKSVTNLPYDVVLTHGHCDHAGGASQFETVYLHEKDIALEKTHATLEHRISDVFHSPWGKPDYITESDFLPQRTESYTPIKEGTAFDLGGEEVELIGFPGHTQGLLVPLLKEDRILILGDGLSENTLLHFPESTSVEMFQKSLLHVKEYEDQFDTCLNFHGNGVSNKQIINDTIELCTMVMNHEDAQISANRMGYDGMLAREKDHPGKFGNFIYDPEKIRGKKNL